MYHVINRLREDQPGDNLGLGARGDVGHIMDVIGLFQVVTVCFENGVANDSWNTRRPYDPGTRPRRFCLKAPRKFISGLSVLCLTLALAACSSSSGDRTCQEGGKTYKPGQTVPRSACTSCLCLADGTIGNCTGACAADAGGRDATTDAVKKLDVAALDGPADVPGRADVAPADSPGNPDVSPNPDAVTIIDSPAVDAVTIIDSRKVPDASNLDVAPKPDTAITCSYGGKAYAIGDAVMLSACTRCICQANGTLGLCTGVCMDGGVSVPDGGLAELCTSTGGYVVTQECCSTTSDFPNTCSIGACSCGPTGHNVKVCACAMGCFVPNLGCGVPN